MRTEISKFVDERRTRAGFAVLSFAIAMLPFGSNCNELHVGPCEKAGDCLFDPRHQAQVSITSKTQSVVLIKSPSNNLALRISPMGKKTGIVWLPRELAQVNSITVAPSGNLLVVGMVNGSVYEVIMVDIRLLKTSDTFLAYSPSVSPDAGYVAFKKFYPPHGASEETDIACLYDTDKSAAENRPENAANHLADVGSVVYPETVKSANDDNVFVGASNMRSIPDKFHWDSDSKRYAFVDTSSADTRVVVVDLHPQSGAGVVRSARIFLGGAAAGVAAEGSISAIKFAGENVMIVYNGKEQLVPQSEFRQSGIVRR